MKNEIPKDITPFIPAHERRQRKNCKTKPETVGIKLEHEDLILAQYQKNHSLVATRHVM
jgi:hypothetical protein